MIHLTDNERVILEGHNSKGDQLKFQKDNFWYKADYLGYEGLSEVIVSNMLRFSNIESFVIYQEAEIYYKRSLTGCKSENFIPEGYELPTLYRLFQANYGYSPSDLYREDISEYIKDVVNKTAICTGLSTDEIGRYLTMLIELDAFTLNDDRHFNNIAFLYHDGSFLPAPVFDNGAAFLSAITFGVDIDGIDRIEAKPFSKSFEIQKDAFEELFGNVLQFRDFSIESVIPQKSIYKTSVLDRVREVIKLQIDKYPDLFQSRGFGY